MRLLPLLLLTGCMTHNPWHEHVMHTHDSRFNADRIIFTEYDLRDGLEFEMLCSEKQVSGFLNIYYNSLSVKELGLEVHIDEEIKTLPVRVNEGGQRIRLGEEALQLIISALEAEKTVTLRLAHFKQTLRPVGFKKRFKSLKKNHVKLFDFYY